MMRMAKSRDLFWMELFKVKILSNWKLKVESWESRISWKLTTVNRQRLSNWKLKIESWKLKSENLSELRVENWKLRILSNWRLKVEFEKLRLPRRSAGSSGNLLELGCIFIKWQRTTDNRQRLSNWQLRIDNWSLGADALRARRKGNIEWIWRKLF